jgi:hypothetical protein
MTPRRILLEPPVALHQTEVTGLTEYEMVELDKRRLI